MAESFKWEKQREQCLRSLINFIVSDAVIFLLMRRAPRALEGGPSERQHLIGVGCEDFEWGRRTTKGVFRASLKRCVSLLYAG